MFRNIGLFLLYALVYCVVFFLLFLLSAFLILKIYNVTWLYRILGLITFGSPEFVLYMLSSIIAFFLVSLLATPLNGHGAAFVFALVILVVSVVFVIMTFFGSGYRVMYSAQIMPAIGVAVTERKEMR